MSYFRNPHRRRDVERSDIASVNVDVSRNRRRKRHNDRSDVAGDSKRRRLRDETRRDFSTERFRTMDRHFEEGGSRRNHRDRYNSSDGGCRDRSRSVKDVDHSKITREKSHTDSVPKREIRPTGYKRLEELLGKEKEEILIQLSSSKFGFKELLNEKDGIRRDLRALILRAIVSACKCTTAVESLNSFLSMVQTSLFVRCYMMHHIISLKDDREDGINYKGEIDNVLLVIKTLVEALPSSTQDVKPSLMLLGPTITELQDEGLIDDTFNQRLHDLNAYCKTVESTQCEDVNKTRPTRRKTLRNPDEENPPPDDFRQIPIFPTLNDLTMDTRPYLRKNKIDGSYDNVDHYLDVQFRLLREDMVRPLREGIKEYLQYKDENQKRITDIRVYNDVTIDYPLCSHDCIIYRVHFDVTRFKGIRWQSSKRLIYGSLVCLSADDFQTVFFATVANRDLDDLKMGYLEIKFENEDKIDDVRNKSFVMVETSAFFEAYRHVLQSLQGITKDNMPMTDYIVKANRDVKLPNYLRHSRNITYDLAPLIENCKSKDMYVGIDGGTWPTAESLKLNDSQFSALRTALTKEFSVIQGPPGTGKTYIGLKIVQALLHNQECWTIDAVRSEVKETPILVVCFTNHALDQFVEGIHQFLPSGIIRVGGRSNCEALKNFNLSQLRHKSREFKEVPRHIVDRKSDLLYEMNELKSVMQLAEESIQITVTGVIHESYLEEWMSEKHLKSLEQDGPGKNNSIITWLGLCESESTINVEYDSFYSNTGCNDINDAGVENEETEEMNATEEADLLKDQRLVNFDDVEENTEIRPMKKMIKEKVRKQLVYDTHQKHEQIEGRESSNNTTTKRNREQCIRYQLKKEDKMSKLEVDQVHNVWRLKLNDRWRLYRFCTSSYRDHERQLLFDKQEEYNKLGKQLQEVKLEEDLLLMRNAKLIGMTTIGAAKCRSMIQRIQPKIVVVEEAAEVLEAHILSSLTEGCEHLILIGDHQQLRPNPTVYELAKKFNLEISLFERMLKNGMNCERLTTQHRMRPEISSIMGNHFYNGLKDAPNVRLYENIKGVATNVFFVEHEHKEDAVSDTMSKSNIYEAEFLVRLCKYLIQQGYKQSSITILTTYTGQLFQFKKIMKSSFFKDVRVCAVDNYQGEENDIILLSLVRSNDAGKIGFLKEETRMCVALSRAKKGLFCIGNMKLLAAKDARWKRIVADLRQKKLIGKTIRLCCQNHPEAAVEIRDLNDFTKCSAGGCNKPCIVRLDCGHTCPLTCHPYDYEHKKVKCKEKCSKELCQYGHLCKRECYKKCEERCNYACNDTLQCGHPCKEPCSQPCTIKCEEIVIKLWPCGHKGEYKCHVDDPLTCSTPCDAILKCGHPCQGTCGECKNGRLHKQCTSKCDRTLVCGHGCQEPCTRNCPPCRRQCENRCIHSKCRKRCGEKCTPCRMPCEWQCKHNRCTMSCGELCNRDRCKKPCDKILERCGHPCVGLCGEPCPKKCLICDKEELTTILFGEEDDPNARFIELEDCGHVTESGALDKWMEQEDEENISVQSKVCPICKTPIRRNLRYGNIIKQLQMDIERVKAKINGDEKQMIFDKSELENRIWDVSDRTSKNVLLKEVSSVSTPDQIVDMKNKLQFIEKLIKIKTKGEEKIILEYITARNNIQREIEVSKKWILESRNRMSDQLLEDIASELQRLTFYVELYIIKSFLHTSNRPITDTIQENMDQIEKSVTAIGPLKEIDIGKLKICFKKISENCSLVKGISDTERVQIVKAIGLSKGHWYKCPKGHIYAIGECGGAMVESKCYECGAIIGGLRHRLRDDNSFAGEMDGAQFPSWSEQNNLENYRFE